MQASLSEDDDEWNRMQASVEEAQMRLDGWGRESRSWAWTGGATLADVLEGTKSTIGKGRVRVEAKVKAARTRAEVATRRAATAEIEVRQAVESKALAEERAERELVRAREAEKEVQQAVEAKSLASSRAANAEAAALCLAEAASQAERRAIEAAWRAAEASAVAEKEAEGAAAARAAKEADVAAAQTEAIAALHARNEEAQRAKDAEAAAAQAAERLTAAESELQESISFAATRVGELDDALEAAQAHGDVQRWWRTGCVHLGRHRERGPGRGHEWQRGCARARAGTGARQAAARRQVGRGVARRVYRRLHPRRSPWS